MGDKVLLGMVTEVGGIQRFGVVCKAAGNPMRPAGYIVAILGMIMLRGEANAMTETPPTQTLAHASMRKMAILCDGWRQTTGGLSHGVHVDASYTEYSWGR